MPLTGVCSRACSMAGDVRSALGVSARMAAAGVPATVHSYNALIAAAERAGAWDAGLTLRTAMTADGIAPTQVRAGAPPPPCSHTAAAEDFRWAEPPIVPHCCSNVMQPCSASLRCSALSKSC